MEYRSGNSWVTRIVNATRDFGVDNVVLASLVSVGAVPVVLTGLFFALTVDTVTHQFVTGQLLATAVAVFGPIGIWYYDERVFPHFHDRMADLIPDTDALTAIVTGYDRRFRTRYWQVALPWTGLVVAVVLLNDGFFASIGVPGYTDPAYVAYVLFAVWWGLITGIGFHGALITVRCIRQVGTLPMDIDPLHPDGLGGLSAIGYFAISTTMLISIGSLTLPLAFTIAARGNFEPIVYVAVVCYVLVIVLSFAYPTVYVNRRAQGIREEILEDKRQRIRALQREIGNRDPGETTEEGDLVAQLQIRTIREEYRDYETVNLYPMSIGILSRLFSSVLLPLVFLILEVYILS